VAQPTARSAAPSTEKIKPAQYFFMINSKSGANPGRMGEADSNP
jgi:hypothetical protein